MIAAYISSVCVIVKRQPSPAIKEERANRSNQIKKRKSKLPLRGKRCEYFILGIVVETAVPLSLDASLVVFVVRTLDVVVWVDGVPEALVGEMAFRFGGNRELLRYSQIGFHVAEKQIRQGLVFLLEAEELLGGRCAGLAGGAGANSTLELGPLGEIGTLFRDSRL